LGYYFYDKGVLTGEPSEDRDMRAFEREQGAGPYRLNTSALKRWALSGFKDDEIELQDGDTLVSYDWAQPLAVSVAVGVNASRSVSEEELGIQSAATESLTALEGGVNTLVEQPLLTGITRLFNSGDPIKGFTDAILSAPSSFVPTLSNQLNQYINNSRYNTYDPNRIQQATNYAIRKIPRYAQTLEPMVSVWGEQAEVFKGNSNNLFNVFLNPAFVTEYAVTPESALVMDIFEETGETKQTPRIAPKTINVNGESIDLSPQEYGQYQQLIGTKTAEAFEHMANSEAFMALADTRKAQLMANEMTNIAKEARDEMFGTDTASAITYEDRVFLEEVLYTVRELGETSAVEMVESLDDEQYERFKSVRSGWRSQNTKTLKSLLVSNPTDAVLFVRELPSAEQERLLDRMTDVQYNLYKNGAPRR